jgi:hypothetical protein
MPSSGVTILNQFHVTPNDSIASRNIYIYNIKYKIFKANI